MRIWIWCSWQRDLHKHGFPIIERDNGFNIYEMTLEELNVLQAKYDVDYPVAYNANPDLPGTKACRLGRQRAPHFCHRKED